jgi:two-component system cell cycle response regulator DivK
MSRDTASEYLILVVEDNERNRKLVRDVLDFAGFAVIEAPTAEDGVALAEERRPDLVLMDLQLPGMDGIEALQRLRGDASTRFIPVVAVTAQAMKDDRQRILGAGFDGYLEKPISVRDLPDKVRSFLHPKEGQR